MKAIIAIGIITLCLISGQVLCFRLIGCSGGSVMFKCMNSNQRKSYAQYKGKYFCRNRDCTPGISTEIQHQWVNNRRFNLYDDENGRFFTVFIMNLSREDDGEYTCGNKKKWSHNVELVVKNNTISSDRREGRDHEMAQEESQDSHPESNPLYSTVQLPTNPSDGLLYAAVSFQKHEESPSEATVRFSKDETHCDYASVITAE
ncbi:hypothetical protein QQF64_000279 [Cirrhinus molitorella]|uniref:Ig-like domain-containing protein n=1 Tax=Cirrhinus molitorella TaxID=172907 RepID=A0ABR3NXH8_9TELE